MDQLPIGLCVILTLASGAVFGLDLTGYFSSAAAPIAWVTELSGTVRKLAREEFTWDRAQSGTAFASKDTVATGEDASAKIYFQDGAEVVLEPASMLVIDTRSDELVLSFLTGGGKVRVARGSARRVTAARVPVLRKAAAEADATKSVPQPEALPPPRITVDVVESLPPPTPVSEPATAAVTERRLAPEPVAESVLRDPEISTRVRGELATLESLPPSPSLQSPEDGSRLDLSQQPEVSLSWAPLNADAAEAEGFAGYEISVRPIGAERGAKTHLSKKATLQLPSLEPGRYSWTVRALRASKSGLVRGPAATGQSFEVFRSAALEKAPPPKPRSAVENKKVKLLPVSVE